MKHRLLPLLLTLLLLSGCAAPLITSEYTVVTEHSDADVTEPSDALRAENYEELKYAILDKDVTVTPGAKLIGTRNNPVIVKRGETV